MVAEFFKLHRPCMSQGKSEAIPFGKWLNSFVVIVTPVSANLRRSQAS